MAGMVHLVRHGEVYNPDHVVYASLPGFGLSETGRIQAKELARYLRSSPVVAVWSSPLERAVATAEPIASQHGLPIRVDNDLIEWRLADLWAGVRWEDLPERRPGELEAYLEHPLDLAFTTETLEALAARMRAVLARLAASHDGDVVVVSHQDPVQAARLSVTGGDLAGQHVDKPQHGTVVTLKPGNPWAEVAVWSPEQSESFPPVAETSAEAGVDGQQATEQLDIGFEGESG
jgi:broad specificity phosphatase PhoE